MYVFSVCVRGLPQDQKASWVDSSEWTYSDWKPGHPDIHTEKPVCMEMFQIGKIHTLRILSPILMPW